MLQSEVAQGKKCAREKASRDLAIATEQGSDTFLIEFPSAPGFFSIPRRILTSTTNELIQSVGKRAHNVVQLDGAKRRPQFVVGHGSLGVKVVAHRASQNERILTRAMSTVSVSGNAARLPAAQARACGGPARTCGMMLIRWRSVFSGTVAVSSPSTVMRPAPSISNRRNSAAMMLDFPAPVLPTMPSFSPGLRGEESGGRGLEKKKKKR